MASASLATGLHGFRTRSIFTMQDELSCNKRRKAWLSSYYRQQSHKGCSLQADNCGHKELLTSPKALPGEEQPAENDDREDDSSASNDMSDVNGDLLRRKLENIIGEDDATFSGKELAMLIRNKYGRSYDVQLIKKEFMGRQLLAMNVMWKYREQRSFPLTEEEYLLHLDAVADNLRCWGAVSYIRNSLAKTKERPRIGKAVSIFIDLDESGGRANEWIYR